MYNRDCTRRVGVRVYIRRLSVRCPARMPYADIRRYIVQILRQRFDFAFFFYNGYFPAEHKSRARGIVAAVFQPFKPFIYYVRRIVFPGVTY